MPVATLAVVAGTDSTDNTQKFVTCRGRLQLSAFGDTYPVGGLELRSVLAAKFLPPSNQGPRQVKTWSAFGSGYIYNYIPSTGKLMVLQVPVNGSLTTAAPLTQLGSGANSLSGVFEDQIEFEAQYLRNAG